jgi:hypothetical protein
MAHSTNENYRPSRKYGFGGGLAVGSLLGAYIGYKIGRARGTKKGGTFDTEKKIYRNVKSKFADGGGVDHEKVRKADEIYREHNIERKQKGYKEFSNESATLWDKGGYDERLKLNPKNWYAGGGGIGFKGLANKVAKRYEGKSVAPKYKGEYGKRYSKSEAQEVGRKVAGKVYRQQQSKKFDGGGNIDDLIYG